MPQKHREPEQAAPISWVTLVNDRCDLDLAFDELDGWKHFHTDTIRGRVRSLQLRPKEAWTYFEKARARAHKYEHSLRNHLRLFYLKLYCFENALIAESQSEGGSPSRTNKCLKALLAGEIPPSEVAEQMRTFVHALHLLHQADYALAKKLLKKLIRQSRDRLGDEKTGFYFAAAVAYRGLGKKAEADRQLENASLMIPALDNAFNMGLYAGTASALLRIWGREAEAREWDEFIVHFKPPAKTAEILRERSRRIQERTASLSRVFLF